MELMEFKDKGEGYLTQIPQKEVWTTYIFSLNMSSIQ